MGVDGGPFSAPNDLKLVDKAIQRYVELYTGASLSAGISRTSPVAAILSYVNGSISKILVIGDAAPGTDGESSNTATGWGPCWIASTSWTYESEGHTRFPHGFLAF